MGCSCSALSSSARAEKKKKAGATRGQFTTEDSVDEIYNNRAKTISPAWKEQEKKDLELQKSHTTNTTHNTHSVLQATPSHLMKPKRISSYATDAAYSEDEHEMAYENHRMPKPSRLPPIKHTFPKLQPTLSVLSDDTQTYPIYEDSPRVVLDTGSSGLNTPESDKEEPFPIPLSVSPRIPTPKASRLRSQSTSSLNHAPSDTSPPSNHINTGPAVASPPKMHSPHLQPSPLGPASPRRHSIANTTLQNNHRMSRVTSNTSDHLSPSPSYGNSLSRVPSNPRRSNFHVQIHTRNEHANGSSSPADNTQHATSQQNNKSNSESYYTPSTPKDRPTTPSSSKLIFDTSKSIDNPKYVPTPNSSTPPMSTRSDHEPQLQKASHRLERLLIQRDSRTSVAQRGILKTVEEEEPLYNETTKKSLDELLTSRSSSSDLVKRGILQAEPNHLNYIPST